MTNNDILRRLRFCFNYSDKKMCDIFALADVGATKEQVNNWLRKDDDKDQVALADHVFSGFLNGLIIEKRGKKDGETPVNEKKLNNNLILVKLKIALSLQAEDILALLKQVGFNLGKSELSAFFRKADHKHYRECKDQVLRNLLNALQVKYRPIKNSADSNSTNANKDVTKNKTKAPKQENTHKQGARPKSGEVYHNPAANKEKRTVLKLKPEDIWKK
ncbi:DUF1456 family protein [Colwellia sp. MEBiC06753]